MIYTATKIALLCLFIGLAGVTTTTEFKDIQQDDDIIYSEFAPQYHAVICECGFCREGWNDSVNEHRLNVDTLK